MKKIIFLGVTILLVLIVVGCGRKESRGSYASDNTSNQSVSPASGQLTASEWSDLKKYDYYLSLFVSSQDLTEGLFSDFFDKGYFDTLNRVTVTVQNDDIKLFGASVQLLDQDQQVVYKAVSNAKGIAYLFPKSDILESITNIVVVYNGQTTSQPYQYTTDYQSITIDIDTTNNHQDVIEIMFVIDTTGSMGDEIA